MADLGLEDNRDKALVALAGVMADVDGLGVIVDLANQALGRPATDYYTLGHHWFLHGLFGCLCLAALAALLSRASRWKVFGLALLTAHLHLLCDLVGSRGPEVDGFWPIFYSGPFSRFPEIIWKGQWRLDSWQNVSFTVVLLVWTFRQAWRWGRSPLSLVGSAVNDGFVETLRNRLGRPR